MAAVTGSRAAAPFQDALRTKLASSCLSPEDGRRMGLRQADVAELASFGLPAKLAFEVPYFGLDGKPTGFRRWRYLEDTRTGFKLLTGEKPVRYVQPPGSATEAYLPPFLDWREVARDPGIDLVVTEGELKAACCSRLVAPCVGLGGVYSFMSKRHGQPLLPTLLQFVWEGRKVYVTYDSDARHNHMVVAARSRLCEVLLSHGAVPFVVEVPEGRDGAKQGLDDLVLASGPEALVAALEAAAEHAAAAALYALSEEVTYVRDPGIVVVNATGQKMSPDAFVSHAYANRFYTEQRFSERHGAYMTTLPAAKAWIRWPHRAEMAAIDYCPGQPRVTDDRRLNTWTGWGCEPKRGDVAPWRQLLDHLFAGMPDERKWFEQWCAIPLQQPGVKQFTAAVLWGRATGTGKSLVGATLGRVYGENYATIGDVELQDARREWAQCKQFVMGDDVAGHEQRRTADRLKSMITQERLRIDPKYIPSFYVRDVLNYLFTANHPDAFFLEDDDRRYFVHEVVSEPLPREFYDGFVEWRDSGGASHLFHHLLHLSLDGRTAEDRAPRTMARELMVEDGLSDLGRWVRRLRDDPDAALRFGDAALSGDLWSAEDLVRLYDPDGRGRVTAGGMGRELKRAGFRQVLQATPVRTKSGQRRLFAVRDAGRWLLEKRSGKVAEHYDSTRVSVERAKKY